MGKNLKKLSVFETVVLEKIKKIPPGRITTYGLIAKVLNRPGSARAVGNALNKNPFAPVVPCHRVVKSNGQIGGYNEGTDKKIKLLKQEGIKIKNNRIEDFKNILYKFI
jgi:methylated-DNA-[protein]-cysteine S-methyltransferase